MSNVITANPLKIDTAAGTKIISGQFTPTLVLWVGATATNDLTIQDGAGVTKMVAKAVTATDVLPFPPRFPMQGLIVPTLGSGTIYIYFKESAPLT